LNVTFRRVVRSNVGQASLLVDHRDSFLVVIVRVNFVLELVTVLVLAYMPMPT